ncbi:hypothetical protein QBC44DRAFT_368965 [Cladorrhinum sp. PSN332]|nr:hypothetical protein QBC44DRAFT_368965 [Cladorrhinum sp. PSN332]
MASDRQREAGLKGYRQQHPPSEITSIQQFQQEIEREGFPPPPQGPPQCVPRIILLEDCHRQEVRQACERFTTQFAHDDDDDEATGTASGKFRNRLRKSSFELPLLASLLEKIPQDLHGGPGITILRGFDCSSAGRPIPEILTEFAGVASHVAPERVRQSHLNMVVHITPPPDRVDDAATSTSQHEARPPPYRTSKMAFHTDRAGDVVAMFVIRPAPHGGGDGLFASVDSVYGHLYRHHPDLLLELIRPDHDWPFYEPNRAVMFLGPKSDAPEMLFSRGLLGQHTITPKQRAALDAVESAAGAVSFKVQYQAGDMVFFNNRRILHAREAFSISDPSCLVTSSTSLGVGEEGGIISNASMAGDGDKPPARRHMLRLWLADPALAGTPPWGDHNRGRLHVSDGEWPEGPTYD